MPLSRCLLHGLPFALSRGGHIQRTYRNLKCRMGLMVFIKLRQNAGESLCLSCGTGQALARPFEITLVDMPPFPNGHGSFHLLEQGARANSNRRISCVSVLNLYSSDGPGSCGSGCLCPRLARLCGGRPGGHRLPVLSVLQTRPWPNFSLLWECAFSPHGRAVRAAWAGVIGQPPRRAWASGSGNAFHLPMHGLLPEQWPSRNLGENGSQHPNSGNAPRHLGHSHDLPWARQPVQGNFYGPGPQ